MPVRVCAMLINGTDRPAAVAVVALHSAATLETRRKQAAPTAQPAIDHQPHPASAAALLAGHMMLMMMMMTTMLGEHASSSCLVR